MNKRLLDDLYDFIDEQISVAQHMERTALELRDRLDEARAPCNTLLHGHPCILLKGHTGGHKI